MGSGASIDASFETEVFAFVDTVTILVDSKVVSLVEKIKIEKGVKRMDELDELFKKADLKEIKLPMSSIESGLLKELSNIIKDDKQHARLISCNCLLNLSRDEKACFNIINENLEILELLFKTAKECFDGTTIINEDLLSPIMQIFINTSLITEALPKLGSSEFGLILFNVKLLKTSLNENEIPKECLLVLSNNNFRSSIVQQILKNTVNHNFSQDCLQLILNCFKHSDNAAIIVSLIISEKVPDILYRFIVDLIPEWKGENYGSFLSLCIKVFRNFCSHSGFVDYINKIKGFNQMLLEVWKLENRNVDKLELFFLTVLVNIHTEVDQSTLELIIDLLTNTTQEKGGKDYDFGNFPIVTTINILRTLLENVNNKKVFERKSNEIINVLLIIVEKFAKTKYSNNDDNSVSSITTTTTTTTTTTPNPNIPRTIFFIKDSYISCTTIATTTTTTAAVAAAAATKVSNKKGDLVVVEIAIEIIYKLIKVFNNDDDFDNNFTNFITSHLPISGLLKDNVLSKESKTYLSILQYYFNIINITTRGGSFK